MWRSWFYYMLDLLLKDGVQLWFRPGHPHWLPWPHYTLPVAHVHLAWKKCLSSIHGCRMLQHWLCPGVGVRDSSLELSFRQPGATFSTLESPLTFLCWRPPVPGRSPSLFPRLNLSQGRGHRAKRPPWAHAWKADRAGGWAGVSWMLQSKLRAWAAYGSKYPQGIQH